VVVEIQDNGCGIPPEHVARIFEARFTTKGARVGVGLGLAIAYSVINEHRGSIRVTSEVGEGCTFTIRLPVSLPAPPAA